MKKARRVLGLVLSLVMILTMLPFSALADNEMTDYEYVNSSSYVISQVDTRCYNNVKAGDMVTANLILENIGSTILAVNGPEVQDSVGKELSKSTYVDNGWGYSVDDKSPSNYPVVWNGDTFYKSISFRVTSADIARGAVIRNYVEHTDVWKPAIKYYIPMGVDLPSNQALIYIPINVPNVNVTYRSHVQKYGWQDWKSNGVLSGTSGEGLRLEQFCAKVTGNANLGIEYSTHCQTYGWMDWTSNGTPNGTSGEGKRMEAIMINLTGSAAPNYDIYYRVHSQSYGWLNWAKNGEPAGTAGYAKRVEAIQVIILKKGESLNKNFGGITSVNAKSYVSSDNIIPYRPNVKYRTHVQSYGWQAWKYNGQMSGTSGQAKRLEGIEISLQNTAPYKGGIAYKTHVQTYGWQDWKYDGDMSGTSGQAKRLEAIQIRLTGDMAVYYDVYYRVHAQNFGWLGWAKNGEQSGTMGYAKRLEGIQIVLVPKGEPAPANTYEGVTSDTTQAYFFYNN